MKSKILFAIAIIAFFAMFSCSKGLKDSEKNRTPLTIKLDYSKHKQSAREILGSGGGGDYDMCAGHGGTIGFGQSWDLATCKSGCERGIGFRCGSETYIICNDGTHIPTGTTNNHCPKSTLISEVRAMDGDFVFYDDNTLKVIFKNSVPPSETGNTNFEIESDETIGLPDFISIGGVVYSGYRVYKGIYQINYSDGEFGSVVIPIILVP